MSNTKNVERSEVDLFVVKFVSEIFILFTGHNTIYNCAKSGDIYFVSSLVCAAFHKNTSDSWGDKPRCKRCDL